MEAHHISKTEFSKISMSAGRKRLNFLSSAKNKTPLFATCREPI